MRNQLLQQLGFASKLGQFEKTIDGYEATWIEQPNDPFGLEDGFDWEYELTNNTSEDLDSSGQYVVIDDSGSLTLGPVFVAAGDTVIVSGNLSSQDLDRLFGVTEPGFYDVTLGVAGPADIWNLTLEAVEGSLEESIDPALVSLESCSFSPTDIVEGDVVAFEAVVRNDNNDPVNAKALWDVGEWGWSESYQIAANTSQTVRLDVTFDQTNLDRIGGPGTYDITATVSVQ